MIRILSIFNLSQAIRLKNHIRLILSVLSYLYQNFQPERSPLSFFFILLLNFSVAEKFSLCYGNTAYLYSPATVMRFDDRHLKKLSNLANDPRFNYESSNYQNCFEINWHRRVPFSFLSPTHGETKDREFSIYSKIFIVQVSIIFMFLNKAVLCFFSTLTRSLNPPLRSQSELI